MNIEKAIKFVFEDKEWVMKLIIGTVASILSFFILPAFIVVGYGIQIARNVAAGIEEPLPAWQDWGAFLRDGFWVSLASFLYGLPAILLIGIGGVTFGLGAATEREGLTAAGGGLFVLLLCIAMLYLIALIAVVPAIYIQYIKHGDFASLMRFGEVLALTRANLGDIVLTVLVVLGISLVIGVVAAVPILGWVIALASGAYTLMISSHLYGQIAAKVIGSKADKFDAANPLY